jgi:uncharacterized protein (TIGR01777 family)
VKIVVPGGSGQVGVVVARAFSAEGHEVVVLARHVRPAPWRVVAWDPGRPDDGWAAELDGADVVLNLAGRSVNCRYTPANREEILRSRTETVAAVGEAIRRARRPPAVWLQASTATIYAHRLEAANDELSGVIGGGEPGAPDTWRFSIEVATSWERALDAAPTPATRKVALRSAMIMSPDRGGIFDTLLKLVRRGLGGTLGDGRQYVSWIHEADFLRALRWIIERRQLVGAINVASPNPLPNREFMAELRRAAGVRIGLPATRWMLALGALAMRTETELVLKSRRVVPRRLLEDGFSFSYPEWPAAARELCERRPS